MQITKPAWLKVRYTVNENHQALQKIVHRGGLHTVCESARCPNQSECWGRRTATLMILGDVCSRACRFCAVEAGKPLPPDPEEPVKVARAVREMGLRYAVITSVTRDDLPDGGARHWVDTINAIRRDNAACTIEVLVPDFQGDPAAVKLVIEAAPDVFGHNLETVPELYARVRPRADYQRSLAVLSLAKRAGLITKSGVMVGLGETPNQIENLMRDLCRIGCDILTIGQYLQPTVTNLPVQKYITPEEFAALRQRGLELGIREVVAGPLVRSSYHAEELGKLISPTTTGASD